MAAELQAHLDGLTERHIANGMSPDEARAAARREFGGLEQIKERAREERRWIAFEQGLRDVRFAFRTLRKSPSFTLTAVLTLGLGIGVNAALFTLYDAVALRSMPVTDPDGLVKIYGRRSDGAIFPNVSYAEYVAFRDRNHVLSGLAAVNEAVGVLDDGASGSEDPAFAIRGAGHIPIQWVSENYFSVLGARMALGRGFLPEEGRSPGTAPVAVLSYLYWQRHLHGDPNVLGRTITLGRPYTIVGVAAEEFSGQQPAPPAVWLPLTMWGNADAYGPRGPKAFRLIGRLAPGVTEPQAKADLDPIAAQLAREYPASGESRGGATSVRLERGMRLIALPLNAKTIAAIAPILLGFGMVLLIACTNVANLLLARGVMRQQEIGVRLSLGAGRGRIVRQLFTENLVLCAIGAAVGLTLAIWTLQAVQPIVLGQLPAEWSVEARRWHFLQLAPDARVLAFTIGLTLVAALAAGLLPALQAAKASLIAPLKNAGTIVTGRFTPTQLRHVLVVLQVAVCLTLLSCAGLLARNLVALRRADVGFDPSAVFSVSFDLDRHRSDRRAAFLEKIETLRNLTGVEAVGWAYRAPLLGGSNPVEVRAASQPLENSFVSAGLFRTFGIPLVRGRDFSDVEVEAGARYAIVSESAARALWPGRDPLGQVLRLDESIFERMGRTAPPGAYRDFEVIGVARDITYNVGDTNPRHAYVPLSPDIAAMGAVYLRPASNTTAATTEIARRAAAAGVTLYFDRRMSGYLQDEMLPFSGLAVLSGALGGLALLMASVGLYGVMAFSVSQRVREIGVRIALGATVGHVVRMFIRQSMRLVAVGVALGLVGGGCFALLLSKIIFGLERPFDPVAFGGVTLVFLAVAFVACWLPARRAAKVDPIVALRCE